MKTQKFVRILDSVLLFIAFSIKSYYYVLTRIVGFGDYKGLAGDLFAKSPYGYAAIFSLIMGLVFLLIINNVVKDIYDFAQKRRMRLSNEKDLRKRLLPFDSNTFVALVKRWMSFYAIVCAGLNTVLVFKVEGCVILCGLLYLFGIAFFGTIFLVQVNKNTQSARERERTFNAFIPSVLVIGAIAFALMQLVLFTAPKANTIILNGWIAALITDGCVLVLTLAFFIGVLVSLRKKAKAEDVVPENLTITGYDDAFDEK